MSYNQFSLGDLKSQFGLTTHERQRLFDHVTGVTPSTMLATILNTYTPLATAVNTEKVRSETLVAPILLEFWQLTSNQTSFFSGVDFSVDATKGLTGTADFMLCASPEQYFIAAPIIIIVEAKKESLRNGLGQCGATMLAAQLFNQQHGYPAQVIYGAVTSGTNWQFLTLEDVTLRVDWHDYHVSQVDKILGILLSMVEPLGITISTPTT